MRWHSTTEALRKYPAIRKRFKSPQPPEVEAGATSSQEENPEELIVAYSGNWATEDLLSGVGSVVMGMVLWSASMAFGAVHASAWNDFFPTKTESWMWRCSSVYISFSGLLWSVINLLAHTSEPFDRDWNSVVRPYMPWTNSVAIGALCTGYGALYIFLLDDSLLLKHLSFPRGWLTGTLHGPGYSTVVKNIVTIYLFIIRFPHCGNA